MTQGVYQGVEEDSRCRAIELSKKLLELDQDHRMVFYWRALQSQDDVQISLAWEELISRYRPGASLISAMETEVGDQIFEKLSEELKRAIYEIQLIRS